MYPLVPGMGLYSSVCGANKLSICGEGYIIEEYAAMVVGVLLSVVRM